jgi:hypothetical protein
MIKNTKKRKLGECVCDNCNSHFLKPVSEIKRNLELGRRNFCSRKCLGKTNSKNFPQKNGYDITKHSKNRIDEFTGLRGFLRRVKYRIHEHDIDLEYLKYLWDTQNFCVYTGVQLQLPKSKGFNNPLYTASLDRIESEKGYVKGNLQFISIVANHAKNSMTHEQMLKFCNIIVENKKPHSEME